VKLSTRTRYGVRAMLELAKHQTKGPLQLKVIASRQGISVKYLEQLIAVLKAAGLVKSVRGAKGGYALAKPASQIKLSDCFITLEGPVITAECVKDESYCRRIVDCAVRDVWVKVQEAVMDILGSITLKDLVNRPEETRTPDYQI